MESDMIRKLVGEVISIIDNTNSEEEISTELIKYLDTESKQFKRTRNEFVGILYNAFAQQRSEYCEQMANKMLNIVATEAKEENEACNNILSKIITAYLSNYFKTEENIIYYIQLCIDAMKERYGEHKFDIIIKKAMEEQKKIVSDEKIYNYIRKDNPKIQYIVLKYTTDTIRSNINAILTDCINPQKLLKETGNSMHKEKLPQETSGSTYKENIYIGELYFLLPEVMSILNDIKKKTKSNIELINYLDIKSKELNTTREELVNYLCELFIYQKNEACDQMNSELIKIVTTEAEEENEACNNILSEIITKYLSEHFKEEEDEGKIINFIQLYINTMKERYGEHKFDIIIKKAMEEQKKIVSDEKIYDYIRKDNPEIQYMALKYTTDTIRSNINAILTDCINSLEFSRIQSLNEKLGNQNKNQPQNSLN